MSDPPAVSPPVTAEDRRIIRGLAARVRAIADLPEMEARRRRLREHNALRGDRPIVLCYPEGAWAEVMRGVPTLCANWSWRHWEEQLRMRLQPTRIKR